MIVVARDYRYHATAYALAGQLTRPVKRIIEKQAPSLLPSQGGAIESRIENFQLSSLISFATGYSYVTGSQKNDGGPWLHTSSSIAVIERLNILDMITADRIVARLAASGEVGQEPRIVSVGSRIENLRIAGYPVHIELDSKLGVELDTLEAVRKEFATNDRLRDKMKGPAERGERPEKIDSSSSVRWSLVKGIDAFNLPGIRLNSEQGAHFIEVREFGRVYFGEILIEHGRRALTMLRAELGSPVGGLILAASAELGGSSEPETDKPQMAATQGSTGSIWLREHFKSSPAMAIDEKQQYELPSSPPTMPPRYANAALLNYPFRQFLNPELPLPADEASILRLDIGPLSRESQVQNARSLPEDKLPPDIHLDVMLSSTDFAVAAESPEGVMGQLGKVAHGRFFLPSNGDPAKTPEGGRFLNFYLFPRSRLRHGHARINYYFRNVLVQSQKLEASIGQGGGFTIQTDFTLDDDLTNLESFPERRRISILTNSNGDGNHQIVLRKPETAADSAELGGTFVLREKQVGAIIKDLRRILGDRAPTERRRSPAMLREDLLQLAPKGRELWRLIPAQHAQLFAPLDQDPASYVIQVSRPTSSGFVFPWALIYDIPLSGDRPKICKLITDWDGQTPLVVGTPRECPHGPHLEDVLCPFGFWGFRYSIDQLTSTKDSVFAIPLPDTWDFVVAETQYGVDLKALSDHVDRLRSTLSKQFPNAKLSEGKSKGEIRELLGNDIPLVYFYCHGEKPNVNADTYLGVGKRESIRATDLLDWVQIWSKQKKIIWKKLRPLIFVNACHSVEIYPDTLVSYLDAFVGTASAAGVIGTEVQVNQKLAMDVAQQFFDLLLGQQNIHGGEQRPCTVDEALRAIRFNYLSAGNLLGLIYTPYCWSELCVTR